MVDLKGDIRNRVKRLPKPSNISEALQPIFEGVSNSFHAVNDRFEDAPLENGRVSVDISNLKDPQNIQITVTDNGIGLDDVRFEAFCTTDTDFKINKGGKGVGRLLWLDAFHDIRVASIFESNGTFYRRTFTFRISERDQICDHECNQISDKGVKHGTVVSLNRLRNNGYIKKFPSRPKRIVKHFSSHFLPNFVMNNCPSMDLVIDDDVTQFPAYTLELLVHTHTPSTIDTEEFGALSLAGFNFEKDASASLDGDHQLHFVAAGRTVMSRKIDGLLGISRFGVGNNLVYHGCIEGEYLEERVNQERTHFNFSDATAEDISKICANDVRSKALKDEIASFERYRLDEMGHFLAKYPSFGFEEPDKLLERVPKNATKAEDFAKALVPHRIRRDENRRQNIQKVIQKLESQDDVPADFADAVKEAANDVRAEEQRQLTEYVLRRKIVLEVMDALLRRIRQSDEGKAANQLESSLHQFICPMRIRGDDAQYIDASDHDLWIIDERLTFSRYFSSDIPFKELIEGSQSAERADLLVFDRLHGLGLKDQDPLSRILLVEFKRPGRNSYEEKYLPLNQITRYLHRISSNSEEDYKGNRLRVSSDCVYYCYVVADIVGDLAVHTSHWHRTSNGRGRFYPLSGDFRGSIEVIEWKDLISDAWARNRAFIEKTGLADR